MKEDFKLKLITFAASFTGLGRKEGNNRMRHVRSAVQLKIFILVE
jgi:hypothetical protein